MQFRRHITQSVHVPSCPDRKVLAQKSQEMLGAVIPDADGSPGLGGSGQTLVPHLYRNSMSFTPKIKSLRLNITLPILSDREEALPVTVTLSTVQDRVVKRVELSNPCGVIKVLIHLLLPPGLFPPQFGMFKFLQLRPTL